MVLPLIQSTLSEIVSILTENQFKLIEEFNIKLIYIFGSYATEKNTPTSDLDIAILLNNDYNPMDKLILLGELTHMFKRDDIDLVILNTATSVLSHQIIKYGKLVYMENEETKVNFEVKVLKVYMDMEPFRKTQIKFVKSWIEENNKGDI